MYNVKNAKIAKARIKEQDLDRNNDHVWKCEVEDRRRIDSSFVDSFVEGKSWFLFFDRIETRKVWPFSPFPSQTSFVSTLVTPPKRTVRRFFKGRRISRIHLNFTGILTLGGEKKCFFFIFTCVVINRLKCNSSNYFLFPLINVTILPFRSQIKKKKRIFISLCVCSQKSKKKNR